MRLIIVSGLSGSGKTIALHMLEDLGYYCIDNFPASLLASFIPEMVRASDPVYARTALGIDARNRSENLTSVPQLVQQLRADGVQCEVVFLYADEEVLLKRYSETRRRHPLSEGAVSLRDAIANERALLAPIADSAALVFDTTRMSVHELREAIRERVDRRREGRLSLLFQSFAFKSGVPKDADFVFDVRCLPNPYWEHALRGLTGRDAPVVRYLEEQPEVQRMIDDIHGFLAGWLDEFRRTNRSYLTVAIGCTGGQHRSVFLVERLAQRFGDQSSHVLTRHNELARATQNGA